MTDKQSAAPEESNESNTHHIRGQKVMLSMHLAELYGAEPRALAQAIERNIGCFPEGSVFQLNPEEIAGLESQSAISSQAAPYAFTAQGVAMLSSILFDERNNDKPETCAPKCNCRK